MYLNWKKGSGEWSISETKPCSFGYDSWGPFENIVSLKMKEYELRGLLTMGFDITLDVKFSITENGELKLA